MESPVEKMRRCVEILREIDPFLPVRHYELFLVAATNQGRTVSELARLADIPLPVVSRTLNLFGEQGFGDKPGLRLLERYRADDDQRLVRVKLTSEGRRVRRQLAAAAKTPAKTKLVR